MADIVLDFNNYTYPGPGNTSDFQFNSAPAVEDGFTITNLNGAGGFGNIKSASYNFHGAGTPFASFQNVSTGTSKIQIVKNNAQVWDLKSIQLDTRDIGSGGSVTITGTHADGTTTVATVVTLDSINSLQTFTLPPSFNDLKKVVIEGPINFQFDNIVIRTHASVTSDFGDDGHGDLLWYRDDGTVSQWDSGQIASAHWVGAGIPTSWHIAGHGDFDGNGKNDILWRNDDGSVSIWDNGLIGGAHIVSGAGVVPNSWHIAETGDFDGNGKTDILWRNDDGTVSIWDNGTIGGAHWVSGPGVVPNSWHIAGTGDFDGNGRSDVLWRNDDGTVSIWDNGAIGNAHWISGPGVVPNSWHIAATADYDGNGKTDIAWRNDDGTVSIWDNGAIGGAHWISGPGVVPNDWHII